MATSNIARYVHTIYMYYKHKTEQKQEQFIYLNCVRCEIISSISMRSNISIE